MVEGVEKCLIFINIINNMKLALLLINKNSFFKASSHSDHQAYLAALKNSKNRFTTVSISVEILERKSVGQIVNSSIGNLYFSQTK